MPDFDWKDCIIAAGALLLGALIIFGLFWREAPPQNIPDRPWDTSTDELSDTLSK
jgi:hypothetical protein